MTRRQSLAVRVVLTREESMRVEKYISRVGERVASARLKVGDITLDAARDQGEMMRKTRDRIFEALEREELVES